MRLHQLSFSLLLLLTACAGTGPIFPVERELYDWVKAPESMDSNSDNAPVIAEPVVNFRLSPGDRQSLLRTGEGWRVGQTYLFGFDLRLDRKSLGREKLAVSRLSRQGDPATEIVSVQLDADHGVTVMGRDCIAPADLGTWHRVEVRMKLADNDTGYMEVFCDRKPIWARVNMRTTFPPECRLQDGCNPVVPKPVRYEWQVGLMADRGVRRSILVQMQRLHQRVLLYKPNRVGTL